ncbi:TLR2-like protein, partial [Mya arenaria]
MEDGSYLQVLDEIEKHISNYTLNSTNGSLSLEGRTLYEVPTFVVAVLAVLYGSISIIAIVGNGLVIFVIAKDKRMQTVTYIFIANLASADIIIGLFAIPFQFQPALHQRWDFPHFMCKVAPSFKDLSVSVSVFTLTIISLDRYVAVIYPLKAGFTRCQAILSLVLIWGLGIASIVPQAYYYSVKPVYDPVVRDFMPYCSPSWSKDFGKIYYWVLVLAQYVLPLIAITLAYSRIAVTIWGTKAPGYNLDRERDMARQRTRRKVVKMLIVVVLLFVICWLPLQVYHIISEIRPQINDYKYINVIWFCSNWLAMSNSCYNPFIYGLLNEKFKREYHQLFSKSRCMGRKNGSSNSSILTGNDGSDGINGSKRITLTF